MNDLRFALRPLAPANLLDYATSFSGGAILPSDDYVVLLSRPPRHARQPGRGAAC